MASVVFLGAAVPGTDAVLSVARDGTGWLVGPGGRVTRVTFD